MGEIFTAKPDGIVLPKVLHGDQIRTVSDQIAMIENENNWLVGSIILIAIVESAQAIVNLVSIASAESTFEGTHFRC